MNKKRLLKLADFIEKLPTKKLNMNIIAFTGNKGLIRVNECTSAACAMGWTPAVFPKLVKWGVKGKDWRNLETYVQIKSSAVYTNHRAMTTLFDISQYEAELIFGCARWGYSTPKQVSKIIRSFATTGMLPSLFNPS